MIVVPLNIWQSVDLSQQHSPQSPPAFLLQAAQMSANESGDGPHLFYVGDNLGSEPQYKFLTSEYYAS